MWPLPPRACLGWPAKGNQGLAPAGGRNSARAARGREAPGCQQPALIPQGRYLPSICTPSPKSLFKAQGLKRTERSKTVAKPLGRSPLRARLSPSGEPYSEQRHTLHIISLALLPRTRASQAAGTPELHTQSGSLGFSMPVLRAQPKPSAWRVELLSSASRVRPRLDSAENGHQGIQAGPTYGSQDKSKHCSKEGKAETTPNPGTPLN